MLITIFTPTYNRAKRLKDVYDSLCNQNHADFEWLVIDDGSTDGTAEVMREFQNSGAKFSIRYYYKPNGGKHTAINHAVGKANGDFFLFLDSDDRLCDNALNVLTPELEKIATVNDICGVICNRLTDSGQPLGKTYDHEITDSNLHLSQIHAIEGEYAWCLKTKILKDYPFPVLANERFLTEAVVLNRIGRDYKIKYLPLDIEIGGYNIDGLTIGKTDIFEKSPHGYMLYHKEWMSYPGTPLKEKIKSSICYWKYPKALKNIPSEAAPSFMLRMAWPASRMYYTLRRIKDKFESRLPNIIKIIIAKLRNSDSDISISCIIEDTHLDGHNGINNYVHIFNSKLGRYTYINNSSFIGNCDIGSFTSIGPSCAIGIGDHPTHTIVSTSSSIYNKGPFSDDTFYKGKGVVRIGSDVWIGANVTIRPGIKIGDGAIIGANSVVTEDVPPFSIYAGCPAKFKRHRFSESEIEKLQKVKWWEKDDEWIKNNISKFKDIKHFTETL